MSNKIVSYSVINCCGEHHRIALMKNGQFAMLDHAYGSKERFIALCELGGRMPDCFAYMHVLTHLNYGLQNSSVSVIKDFVPSALQLCDEAIKKRQARHTINYFYPRRSGARLLHITQVALYHLCPFIKTLYTYGHHNVSLYGLIPSDKTKLFQVVAPIRVDVPTYWFRRIFCRGIAIVRGKLTLDIVDAECDEQQRIKVLSYGGKPYELSMQRCNPSRIMRKEKNWPPYLQHAATSNWTSSFRDFVRAMIRKDFPASLTR